MNINIVSSMAFPEKILEVKKYLEDKGHSVSIPPDTYSCLEKPKNPTTLKYCIENNLLRRCFERIKDNDAILVLNYEKNKIEGYVGGASLMEIGVAYLLGKKIFILNTLPEISDLKYVGEILQTNPTILNGDLNKI